MFIVTMCLLIQNLNNKGTTGPVMAANHTIYTVGQEDYLNFSTNNN